VILENGGSMLSVENVGLEDGPVCGVQLFVLDDAVARVEELDVGSNCLLKIRYVCRVQNAIALPDGGAQEFFGGCFMKRRAVVKGVERCVHGCCAGTGRYRYSNLGCSVVNTKIRWRVTDSRNILYVLVCH